MKRIQIGLQLHSVREDFAENPAETLQRVARIGYEGIEGVYSALTKEAQFYANALKESGLKCYSVMLDYKNMQPGALEKALEYLSRLSCDCVVLGSIDLSSLSENPSGCRMLLDFIAEAAEKIRAAGFRTGFHNHDRDHLTCVYDGRTFFDYLFDNTPENFMMMLDTGNAQGGGADPIALLTRYPHRTQIAHFKGYSAEKAYLTPVWESEMDTDLLLDTLIREGNTEVLSVEFGKRGEYVPFERAERSYRWLSEKLSKKGLY